jgi:predicted nucleotidyltransferase
MVATTAELDEVIADFRGRLEAEMNVDLIVLYGSYARGNAYEDSDIDLAVISRDFDDLPAYRRQELISDASLHRDGRISPIGYSLSEYRAVSGPSFLREILKTGRVVYSNEL